MGGWSESELTERKSARRKVTERGMNIKLLPLNRAGDGRKRSVMTLPSFGEYTLGGPEINLANLSGQIKTPDGMVVPAMLKRMANKKLGM